VSHLKIFLLKYVSMATYPVQTHD